MKQDIAFNEKNETTYGRGYAYLLKYHLVWCTDACREILTPGIGRELSAFLLMTAGDIGMDVLEAEVMPDHVHLFVSCRPQARLSDDIKILKGNTARWLYPLHPELKEGSGMWDAHYLAVIDNTDAQKQIGEYLANRRRKGGMQL